MFHKDPTGDRLIERLAEAAHELAHERASRGAGLGALASLLAPSRHSLQSWAQWNDQERRHAHEWARSLVARFRVLGLAIVVPDPNGPQRQLSDQELERSARLEHVRWVREKFADGWQYGAERSPSKRLHPSLIPWNGEDDPGDYSLEERDLLGPGPLSDEEREKDRAVLRDFEGVAKAAGLALVAVPPDPTRGTSQ